MAVAICQSLERGAIVRRLCWNRRLWYDRPSLFMCLASKPEPEVMKIRYQGIGQAANDACVCAGVL
jgi:hypothetical protein